MSASELPTWPVLQGYSAYALTLAGGFYFGMLFFGRHLSDSAKNNLALWLSGRYESSWSHHFCKLFDAVFGKEHLSRRCFVRSAVASVLAVIALWILVDPVLDLLNWRTTGGLDLWRVIALGAAINILPDYVSLLETRWLLQRLETIRTLKGQILVLFADALFTGAIIWFAITGVLLARGDDPLSTVEMLALFSTYSIFFYSTFLTSVWAWLYCLSIWFMRIFSRTFLSHILAIEEKPTEQVALVGAALLFAAAMALAPLLPSSDTDRMIWFDIQLCEWFPDEACPHVVRMSHGSCSVRHPEACTELGRILEEGRGVPRDETQAAGVYRQACYGGGVPSLENSAEVGGR